MTLNNHIGIRLFQYRQMRIFHIIYSLLENGNKHYTFLHRVHCLENGINFTNRGHIEGRAFIGTPIVIHFIQIDVTLFISFFSQYLIYIFHNLAFTYYLLILKSGFSVYVLPVFLSVNSICGFSKQELNSCGYWQMHWSAPT